MTDKADADPKMPDALEVAAAQDREFARTGKLVGPLHGVVMAIKDQYDTFDMRTTSGARCVLRERPPARRLDVRRAAARRRRDHPREGEPRRIRIGYSAQLVRRHVLQSLRHRAQSARLELRIRLRGWRESRHLRHRGGIRLFDPRTGERGQHRRHRSHTGAREPQGHGPVRHQHARRSYLPHRGRCRAHSRRDRGLRSERRAHRVQHRPHAEAVLRKLRAERGDSTACASASCANT